MGAGEEGEERAERSLPPPATHSKLEVRPDVGDALAAGPLGWHRLQRCLDLSGFLLNAVRWETEEGREMSNGEDGDCERATRAARDARCANACLTAAANSGVVHPCAPIGLRPHGVEKLAQLGVGAGILFDGVEILQQPLFLRNFAGNFRLFQSGAAADIGEGGPLV